MDDYERIIRKRRAAILGHWPTMGHAAREIGTGYERLSRIVNGRVKPKPEEMRQLAWRLQMKIEDLFPEPLAIQGSRSRDEGTTQKAN